LRRDFSSLHQKTRDTALKDRGPDLTEVDCALADAFLEIQIAELQSGHFQCGNPALYTGEAVFSLVSLMLRNETPDEARREAMISRLRSLPAFLDPMSKPRGRWA
jgi:hypothetical protein